MVGVDVAQCPCQPTIAALLLRRLELVLVALDQQAEELAAGVAIRIPFDAEVQHGTGHVEADQPVGEVLQIHALGELLQAGQGDGHHIVLLADKGIFQLDLQAVSRDVAGPADPGFAIVVDGDRSLVDVARLFAQLDIVQGLDLERGGALLVAKTLQLVGVVADPFLMELFPLGLLADLLQQAAVADLLEPLEQQDILQLRVVLPLQLPHIRLDEIACLQRELVDTPAGPA